MIKDNYYYIGKIASSLNLSGSGNNDKNIHIPQKDKNYALKLSSISLKIASEKMRGLEQENDKLKKENEILLAEKTNKEKQERVKCIVDNMFKKGLVSKNEMQEKREALFNMSDESLEEISNFVNNISEKEDEDYVSSLRYIVDDCRNDNNSDMAVALDNFIKSQNLK